MLKHRTRRPRWRAAAGKDPDEPAAFGFVRSFPAQTLERLKKTPDPVRSDGVENVPLAIQKAQPTPHFFVIPLLVAPVRLMKDMFVELAFPSRRYKQESERNELGYRCLYYTD